MHIHYQQASPGFVPEENHFDVLVIGAGSGGVRSALHCTELDSKDGTSKVKIAVCEMALSLVSSETTGGVGGTCVLRGCIPKKLLWTAAQFRYEIKDSIKYGWRFPDSESKAAADFPATLDWATMQRRKAEEIMRISDVYRKRLQQSGVTLFEGRAELVGPHSVSITPLNGHERIITCDNVIISTGAAAKRLEGFEGAELAVTSDEILSLSYFPRKVVVVGGGYIGVEQSSIMRGLGSEVHLAIRYVWGVCLIIFHRLSSETLKFNSPHCPPTHVY